ncbi:MAG: TIM barrel protein [Chitinivibrionales bacterium]|nr:TIM barrel protein [Chitinivibrionales bacterium]MBD3394799.1 TIM barrel protein [Chitinivibrionales bacterium]
MNSMKGPGICLPQFLRDKKPYNTLENIGKWVAGLGYKGVQIPTWTKQVFDVDKAAASKTYCREIKGKLKDMGLDATELGAFVQGQVLAMHPAYETAFGAFYPEGLDDKGRVGWATEELKKAVVASANMGLSTMPVLSGALAWHMLYPWPQRPDGLITMAFKELWKRWRPVMNLAREHGIKVAFELHPGSDVFDGATFEMFLDVARNHPAVAINYDPSHFVLQQLDYCEFIQLYGERIAGFHVKDAEFRPSGRVGVYGGYQGWAQRAGRFRSLGDGQVDFSRVFTLLTEAGYRGWAVLEWECCVKSPEQGAAEGAPFIAGHLIDATEVAFDDFAGGKSNDELNKKILGLTN